MELSFQGKVALVTGAGGGIGLATAEAFANAGAAVILADRDGEKVGRAAERLTSAGRSAVGGTCDVTDPAEVEAMMARAVGARAAPDLAPRQVERRSSRRRRPSQRSHCHGDRRGRSAMRNETRAVSSVARRTA